MLFTSKYIILTQAALPHFKNWVKPKPKPPIKNLIKPKPKPPIKNLMKPKPKLKPEH